VVGAGGRGNGVGACLWESSTPMLTSPIAAVTRVSSDDDVDAVIAHPNAIPFKSVVCVWLCIYMQHAGKYECCVCVCVTVCVCVCA